jgi:hypothetical protein
LVGWLHGRGGFMLMLQAFGALWVLVILGAFVFPAEERPLQPAAHFYLSDRSHAVEEHHTVDFAVQIQFA